MNTIKYMSIDFKRKLIYLKKVIKLLLKNVIAYNFNGNTK